MLAFEWCGVKDGRQGRKEVGVMNCPDVWVGSQVRVNEKDQNPHLRGQVGTVTHRYGDIGYAAFEVLFGDGRSELFWSQELEEARRSSVEF
jgi:hypothetical protein